MKKVKIKYIDWWTGFNCDNYLINKILKKYYNVVLSDDNPDYVIGSMYTKEALDYDCIRIFYSGENFCPDFNLYDYAIGFENMTYGDRYIYVPNYIMNPRYADDVAKMLAKHTQEAIAEKIKSEFCSYVVSNGRGDSIRAEFFEALSQYKKINSGGRYLNNIGLPNGVADKYEFQKKHKFSICFENSTHPGYITEKLVQGFAAGTIPIYWGSPDVIDVFNRKAMVVVAGKEDIPRAVEQIKEIDNNDDLYQNMLKQPALIKTDYITDLKLDLERFLLNIFEQPLETAIRRPHVSTVDVYYSQEKVFKHRVGSFIDRVKKTGQEGRR